MPPTEKLTTAQAELLMKILKHGYEHQMSWDELCRFSAKPAQDAKARQS